MSTSKAPIGDLSFYKKKTPQKSRATDEASADSSTDAARRNFFPSNLFGNSSSSAKKPPQTPPRKTNTPSTAPSPLRSPARRDAIVVRSMKIWDVKMPPKRKHMVSGHLVPTVRGAARFLQRHRRVSIEVHGPPVYANDAMSVLSAMTPVKAGRMQEFLQGGSPEADVVLQDKDVVRVRILKPSTEQDDSHSPHDDEDLSTLGPYAPDDTDGAFVEHYTYRLEDVEIIKVHGRTCEVKFGSGSETIVRNILFEAEKEAFAFDDALTDLKTRVQERAKRRAEEYRQHKRTKNKGVSPLNSTPRTRSLEDPLAALEAGDVEIKLLVDIVSGIDLPIADLVSSDPYVVVKLGNRQVHRTKVMSKTLNPIWTVETSSLFLLELSSEQFFSSPGLTFLVKDYDAVGGNETLGKVVLSHDELLDSTGDRKEYAIVQDKAGKTKTKPRLVLRIKEASGDDIQFMHELQNRLGDVGIYANETFLPPRPPDSKLLKRMTKRTSHVELHRVKPFPDPDDPERTKWMSSADIQTEAQYQSKAWVEAGSGKLGKLYVEVIGCDDLPNMDAVTLNVRDKTDAFACLVFEDVIVNTDVIGDTLKPRWMPWSCRAFVFNISHPQSDLFVGVFDYDPPNSIGQVAARTVSGVHDPIGRVDINLGRFLQKTVYELKYPLYYNEEGALKMKARGSISIRLRVEWNDSRMTILKGAMPPPPMYVSCKKRLNWDVAHYTVSGPSADKEFSIAKLTEYIEELQNNEKLLPQVVDIALNLFLWRGGYKMSICGISLAVPVHSMIAFVWGLLVSWDFNLFPAFLFFAVGWAFLAMNQHGRNIPSPWHKPLPYGAISSHLLFPGRPNVLIKPNENIDEYRAYLKKKEEEIKEFEEEKRLMEAQDEQFREQLAAEIATAESEDTAIQTKRQGINLNPLKPILYPAQLELEKVVIIVRIVKSVANWDEPLLAWWITTASLIACFIVLWIPWGFLFRWTLRISAFVFLGPWFAIYDRCFIRRSGESIEDNNAEVKKRMKQRYLEVKEAASSSRTRKERAMKLQSMKKYLYGKYLLNVPNFCIEKYPSYPLPSSTARPFEDPKLEINIVDRKYGQKLTGDMIPTREFQLATNPEQGRRRNRKRFLPWRGRKKGGEVEPLLASSSAEDKGGNYESIAAK